MRDFYYLLLSPLSVIHWLLATYALIIKNGAGVPSLYSLTQVAGHGDVSSTNSTKVIVKKTNRVEASFYLSLAQPQHAQLRPFVPQFHGYQQIPSSQLSLKRRIQHAVLGTALQQQKRYQIHLGNVLAQYNHPALLDLKLGVRRYDDDAPWLKRVQMIALSYLTDYNQRGVYVEGVQVYNPHTRTYFRHTSWLSRIQAAVDSTAGFQRFFPTNLPKAYRKFLIKRFRRKLGELAATIMRQDVRIYGSSLLFSYEGDVQRWYLYQAQRANPVAKVDYHSRIKSADLFDLKLIDFAHATWQPNAGPDSNLTQGLASADQLLKRALVTRQRY
ncbi:hypothetical protein H4R35_002867 [Dimargaris xerosporica]|nr:hypothetical protein H4R35_002867 [Dimargaris xerosporica]